MDKIYVAVFNCFGRFEGLAKGYASYINRFIEKECSVTLVEGDTLCFTGLTGPEISDLMETTGADYDYSYDSPEDAWREYAEQFKVPELSWEYLEDKYPLKREEMDEDTESEYVEDCFDLYETEGFSSFFWAPYSDHINYIGQSFKVIERVIEDEEHDLSVLPMWKIKFPDGFICEAFPEEIIPSEMRANGCNMLENKPTEIINNTAMTVSMNMGKEFRYLSECDDFELLKKHFDLDRLQKIEEAIRLYEETDKIIAEEDGVLTHVDGELVFTDAIAWYQGKIDTEHFIAAYTDDFDIEPDKKPGLDEISQSASHRFDKAHKKSKDKTDTLSR